MHRLLRAAPFIVGSGARYHMDPVIALAEQAGAPVATTFKAKGQISDHHPLGCGLGRSGTPIASWFINECDLVVAFSASLSNHTGIAAYKPIVQVDFDPMALALFHAVEVHVLGHVGVTARLFAAALPTDAPFPDLRPEVAERWASWRAEKARRRADDFGHGMTSAAVFDAMSTRCPTTPCCASTSATTPIPQAAVSRSRAVGTS